MSKLILVFCFLFFILYTSLFSQGFLRRDNKKIVNDNGEEVILRGMGLGGWMLQEGYMMQTSSFANAQFQLKAKISELIGEEGMNDFYDAWLAAHCRKADIDSLASWGFNSVRLPMHYNLFTLPIEEEPQAGNNTWLQKGFELTDSLLSWCAANEMYLILDLHAAPGGQGYEAGISDYDDSKPSLWDSNANWNKTVALWRRLAERYANEPWIGGYDLINETNWNMTGNYLLKALYLEITNAIRDVDINHIIFIEGNWFANDFTGLTPPWDDNMAYSFHKYWSYNNQGSIQWMLDIRNSHNVPIWCGESGENSNVWFRDAIKLFEENGIGWAWWPMKKIESISGPLSIKKSEGYQRLLDYWSGTAGKPSVDFAVTALMEAAENAKLENCEYHKDVIDAMIRQPRTNETKPFKDLRIPGAISVVDYDLGTQNNAYYDTEIADYHVSTGTWTGWNNGWAYRNDGVDIEPSGDDNGPEYSIGWIGPGEWLKYTFISDRTDSFKVSARVASSNNDGAIELIFDGESPLGTINVKATGGWHVWDSLDLGQLYLETGEHELKMIFKNSGFNINQIQFEAMNVIEQPPSDQTPKSFELGQNYPNPFNSVTEIPFLLNSPAQVKLDIYNSKGQLVKSFPKAQYDDGPDKFIWDSTDNNERIVSSGVFFYRMKAGPSYKSKKMIYLR